MAVAMKQKDLRSDSWNPRAFTPGRMSTWIKEFSNAKNDILILVNSAYFINVVLQP